MDDGQFRCMNCGKLKVEADRACMSVLVRAGFFIVFLIASQTITSPKNVCRSCVWQFYLFAAIVLIVGAIFVLLGQR